MSIDTQTQSLFDIDRVRADFPILKREVKGYPLVYLDNAASTQKPQCVIDSIVDYYTHYNANVHRGVHQLSQEATDAFEAVRKKVADFVNASATEEIIYTKGTTESINLVAYSLDERIKKGDEIIISYLEHHANIVPWQMLCQRTGATLKVIPINDKGEISLDTFRSMLSEKTKFVSVVHISNSLGVENPVHEITKLAHEVGAWVLVDAAQSIQHKIIDVQAMGCDFLTFSGHKMYAPTGIGVLYGKKEALDLLPPFLGGGEMIMDVTFEKTTYNELPFRMEAGTPHMEGVIGLGVAIDYLNEIGREEIIAYEKMLYKKASEAVSQIPSVQIYGEAEHKSSVISFNVEGIDPYDIGMILDQMGIAVRTGQHCTQTLMDYYKIPGTVRASFTFYNTLEEADKLCQGVHKAIELLS